MPVGLSRMSQSNVLLTALIVLAATTFATGNVKTDLTAEDKVEYVLTHNRLRQAAFPKPISMNFIVWNSTLEAMAVRGAGHCKWDHDYSGELKNLGENLYNGAKTGAEVTLKWFVEKAFMDLLNDKCLKRSCGHYRQLMSESTTEMGCGIKRCGGDYIVLCVYNRGQVGFRYGAPCSSCSEEMPFCLQGLCVSKELAARPVIQEFDPTLTAKSIECKLVCQNCGTRVDTAGECKCNCPKGTEGTFCEKKAKDFTASSCSPCMETPPCLNGGTEDKTDKAKCKCTCGSKFVGERCEIAKDVYDNSVQLVIATKDEFVLNLADGKFGVFPPVSRSLFNTKIWTNLKLEIANAVNGFCRTSANFVTCCPGKTFPGDAKVASATHISASDVKFTESSFENTQDGSLNLFVHAEVSSSAMCAVTARRKRQAATKLLPQAVLLSAIGASNSASISPKLVACCDNVVLKNFKKASFSDDDSGDPGGSAGPSGCLSSLALVSAHLLLYLLICSFLE